MKSLKVYLFILIVIITTASSCKKALVTTPEDFLSPGEYYQTESQLDIALNGVYEVLGNNSLYKQNIWNQLAVGTDLDYYNFNSLTLIDIRLYNVSSSDPIIAGTWNTLYSGINRANALLEGIENSPVNETIKNRIKSQALFLRGYYYFLLVDLWGGVPLRLKATTSVDDASCPRSSVKEVYDQVLQDMTAAEAILPTTTYWGPNGSGRISKSAAQGILSRVCLTMAGSPLRDVSKFNDAKNWAQKVMTSGLHVLNPDYKQIFINLVQDKYDTKESIWEAEFTFDPALVHQEFGNLGYVNGIKNGNIDYGFVSGDVRVQKALWDLYQQDPNDIRRDWNIAPFGYGATDTIKTFYKPTQIWDRYPGKWRREYELVKPKSKFYTPTNFPILRYADVLLMYAEAVNGATGPNQSAMDAVNLVRKRASATPFVLGDYASSDKFLKIIQDERARELFNEGTRKRDLIRWGILVETLQKSSPIIAATVPSANKFAAYPGINITDRDVLLPIPIGELTLNKALGNKNNPGF
jgi:hypothetical protein